MADLKPIELCPHEKLFLLRRRSGKTQVEMAAAFGVSMRIYRNWEKCRATPPDLAVLHLEDFEKAVILRRRAGTKLCDFAKELGVSRFWVIKMERGLVDCRRLKKYWGIP